MAEIKSLSLSAASADFIGQKRSQEDRNSFTLDLKKNPHYAFFGVYDGHGGERTAEYCEKWFHQEIDAALIKQESTTLNQLVTQVFIKVDSDWNQAKPPIFMNGYDVSGFVGTTVCILLVNKNTKDVLVANLGDTRCVLSRGGHAVRLSTDHMPEHPEETKRIVEFGHRVDEQGRVDGVINVSRSIGDTNFKDYSKDAYQQSISPIPQINEVKLGDEDDFLVLATDGVFSVLEDEAVIQFVKQRLEEKIPAIQIPQLLIDECKKRDVYDNVTAVVVALNK